MILVWACLSFLIFKEKTAPTGLVSRATKTGGWNAGVKGRKVRMDLVKSVVILENKVQHNLVGIDIGSGELAVWRLAINHFTRIHELIPHLI